MTARKQISGNVIISFGDTIFEDKIIEQILNTKNDIVIGVEPKWREYYEKRMDNPPAISDFIAIKNGKIIKLFRNLKEFDEDCIITEFSGLFKLSAKGSKIITEKYEFLEQNHSGKFHDAVSLKKAKMIELLQELYENGVSMEAISLKGKWCEIDTPHDLEIAKKMFK
jgi:choline kinase